MKDPRHLLILLGFICQGFTWGDHYLASLAFIALWFLCLSLKRDRRWTSEGFESVLFAAIFLVSFAAGHRTPFERFMAIGNSLLFLQAVRLTRPVNYRDKALSIAMAVTQLAIGAQVMVDYDFILVLAGAIVLLPKSLYNLSMEDVGAERRALGNSFVIYGAIATIMVLFFLLAPRIRLAGLTGFGPGNARPSLPSLETAGRAREGSEETLFIVRGETVQYLKSYALDQFDGNTWTAGKGSFAKARDFSVPSPAAKHREVEVKQPRALGRSLPTDGHVVQLRGNFFQNPYISLQGNVVIPLLWIRPSNVYEYWSENRAPLEKLSRRDRETLTTCPAPSPRLREWLNLRVGKERNPKKIALKLQDYLRDHFLYEMGEPILDRVNPVEDFIFNRRKGHCERFASALATLLRVKGVPARVAIGYAPGDKNPFGDFYAIKGKHGHAWTEAFIAGKGWTTLDATPYANQAARISSDFVLSLRDWIDYLWYNKIVNFSVSDQENLLKLPLAALKRLMEIPEDASSRPLLWSLLPLVALGAGAVAAFRRFARNRRERRNASRSGNDLAAAEWFYERMLHALAARGVHRRPDWTPYEFLREIDAGPLPFKKETGLITQTFCEVKYGGMTLPATRRGQIDDALKQLSGFKKPRA